MYITDPTKYTHTTHTRPHPHTPTQASFAFNVLEEALRLILEKMEDLSSLAAETARLAGLLAALRAADVDAGGDGTVIGFGSPPKQHQHHYPSYYLPSSSSSSSVAAVNGINGVSSSSKDVNSSSSALMDVELAAVAAGGMMQHGGGGSSGIGADGGSTSSAADLAVGVGAGVNGVGGAQRLSRVLRLLDGSVSGLSVEGLTACVPGRHHQPMVVCQDLSFNLEPGE